MSDTTVVVAESGESESEEAAEEVAEAVENMGDAIEEAHDDAVNLDHESRITRIEDGLAIVAASVEALTERMESVVFQTEMAQESANQANETVAEVATEAADAIQEVTQDVEEASEEITPDEVPTVTEHAFFKKWGRR